MTTAWILTATWGLGAILLAELVRDLYHVLAHIWPPVYRLHVWHHRVFRPDLTAVSQEVYRQATWHNDVPEALVMLTCGFLLWLSTYIWMPEYHLATLVGMLYTLTFLLPAMARGFGVPKADELTDLTHLPGPFATPPSHWLVNRPYHWRHHFDNQNAYFCGTLTLVDKIMGTALSLKGKTVAVTGASGTLGRSLLQELQQVGAKPIALTSQSETINILVNGEEQPIPTVTWQIGKESALKDLFQKTDILILNHGINVKGERTKEAIDKSYQINTFSTLELMELFLTTVKTNQDIARKEVWINTSEAESNPAFSPLYELSKRAIGELVTLRRLDAPCVIRKLILGPFKSNLNPIGVMSSKWVAKQIIKQAKSDIRNIIVTINPLTFVTFPVKEFFVSTYFKLFSRQPSKLEG